MITHIVDILKRQLMLVAKSRRSSQVQDAKELPILYVYPVQLPMGTCWYSFILLIIICRYRHQKALDPTGSGAFFVFNPETLSADYVPLNRRSYV